MYFQPTFLWVTHLSYLLIIVFRILFVETLKKMSDHFKRRLMELTCDWIVVQTDQNLFFSRLSYFEHHFSKLGFLSPLCTHLYALFLVNDFCFFPHTAGADSIPSRSTRSMLRNQPDLTRASVTNLIVGPATQHCKIHYTRRNRRHQENLGYRDHCLL